VRRKTVLIVLVILTIVVLLNLPVPVARRIKAASDDNLAPFQNVLSLVVRKASEAVSAFGRGRQAAREREKLVRQVAELQHEVRRLRSLETDNAELRKHLGFRRRSPHNLVFCEVVGRGEATGWWQTVRVDRGELEGIRPNQPVVTAEGLVGRTSRVSHHTADILLLTDPTCRVAVKVSRLNARGILSGKGVSAGGRHELEMLCAVNPCRVNYLPKDALLIKGDSVVTSGLGGLYPPGIPVGEVVQFETHKTGLYQSAEVVPKAPIEALRYVFVIVESGSAEEEDE